MPAPDLVVSKAMLGSTIVGSNLTVYPRKTLTGWDILDADGVTVIATITETQTGWEIYIV